MTLHAPDTAKAAANAKTQKLIKLMGASSAAAFLKEYTAANSSLQESEEMKIISTQLANEIHKNAISIPAYRVVHTLMLELDDSASVIKRIKDEECLIIMYGPEHDKSKIFTNGVLISGCNDIPSSVAALFDYVERTYNQGDQWKILSSQILACCT